MPTEAILTLISLGVFLLAAVYYSALTLFSISRLYFILITFSLTCILFSIVQTAHVLNPGSYGWNLGVQLSYILIVLLNPILLLVLLEPDGIIRKVLLGILAINTLVTLLLSFAAISFPGLLVAETAQSGTVPFQYLRAVTGLINWIGGFVIMFVSFGVNKNKDMHRFLSLGYMIITVGSLVDTVLIATAVENGNMLPDYFPGLLSGLLVFHVSVTLSLSQSYRQREIESETNASAMEVSKKELMRMAYWDDMTGRPNRKSFLLHLNHHLIETLSLGKTKAVFLIDLDHFRDVNDTFGYGFGDLVIKNVGEKIEDRFGVRDRLYRLEGDQFAIVWDDIRDRGHALDLARIILKDLTSLVEIDNANLYMGVSLGAVMLPDDGDEVNVVFRRCETALAEAKRDRNTYFFYSNELEDRAKRKMSIVNALREALKKELFLVVYQPIVSADGKLSELEALIRCRHPSLNETSPEVFISVAESSGLIIPITWWMMNQVARDAARFSKRIKNIRINVNMSPKILKSRDLIERLVELDKRYPINGNLIGFEITEGAIIENVDQVLKNLKSLRERGFHIALDDFGTGYSSLSYIKNLPLDTIKIDKRFISGISSDSRDEALINSIISIAGNLKMDLVAEGVEMPNQLAYLNDRGCQLFQGYLFSKPVPLDDIIESYTGI